MAEIPFKFVLEELSELEPYTKPMFGFTGVYVGEMIVLVLREREKFPEDNGVWVATFQEHQPSLKKELPSMRSLKQFGPGPTDWQVIPLGPRFEEEAIRLCGLILKKDSRIGKIPKRKKPRKPARRKK